MDGARARKWCLLVLLSAALTLGYQQCAKAQAVGQAGDFGPDETAPEQTSSTSSSASSDRAGSSQPAGTTSSSDRQTGSRSDSIASDQPSSPTTSSAETSAQSGSTPLFDPNSPESQAEQQANRQSERDNLFVKYLLISCAAAGVIIAFVVWRSMPPKPKADT